MIDKDALLKARIPERIVDISGVGQVRIRGLSRFEALGIKKIPDGDSSAAERYMLRHALVEPALSPEEIAQWQEISPAGELEAVTTAIAELSGMNPEAPRQAYDQFRGDGPGDGVRPGGEAGPDGGGAPGDDQ